MVEEALAVEVGGGGGGGQRHEGLECIEWLQRLKRAARRSVLKPRYRLAICVQERAVMERSKPRVVAR